jgi:hypothetical protein
MVGHEVQKIHTGGCGTFDVPLQWGTDSTAPKLAQEDFRGHVMECVDSGQPNEFFE